MNAILGDEDRLKALAEDLLNTIKRVAEGSTVKGKAMFVCAAGRLPGISTVS